MKEAFLIVTRNPYPINGGDKKRMWTLINFLKKKNYKIDIFVISYEDKIKKNLFDKKIKIINFKINKINIFKSLFIFLFKKKPLQAAIYYDKKILEKISSFVSKKKYEIGFFHLLRSCEYVDAIKVSKNKFLDICDSHIINYERSNNLDFIFFPIKIFFNFEKKLLINYYKKVIKKFNKIFYISKFDLIYDQKLFKIKNKFKYLNLNSSQIKKKNLFAVNSNNILIMGNFKSYANLNLVYEAKKLKKKMEKFRKILLYGEVDFKLKILLFILNDKNISYIGKYENLKKNKKKFFLALSIQKISSGFQNKILDYKKLSLPILVSSNVMMGMPNYLKNYCYLYNSKMNYKKTIKKISNINSNKISNQIEIYEKKLKTKVL